MWVQSQVSLWALHQMRTHEAEVDEPAEGLEPAAAGVLHIGEKGDIGDAAKEEAVESGAGGVGLDGDAGDQHRADYEEEEGVEQAARVFAGVEDLDQEEDEAADHQHDQHRGERGHEVVGGSRRFAIGGHHQPDCNAGSGDVSGVTWFRARGLRGRSVFAMIDQHPPDLTHPPDAHLHFLRDPAASRPVPRSARGSRLTTSSSSGRCGRSSSRNCISCHGPQKQKGELRLDARAGFVAGGQTGALIKPGEPDKSLLIQVIRYDGDIKMPQKGKMADADIATLTRVGQGRRTVAGGCGDQAEDGSSVRPARASEGALVVSAGEAADSGPGRCETRSMHSCWRSCERRGFTFAPPAEKRVLLRRVYFDLIGLPPTPEEIARFLKDDSPDAFERVVDRLLASPHYGERWGRHWLDLVRYAETQGHEFDFDIADAWRYRDYVVRAFNADLPFNEFLTEHIAGDLLAQPRRNAKDGTNESLVATGFWWMGEAKHSPVDSRAEYADKIDNQIDVFGKAVLGLTVACARCHDHKFDAISTKDYYSLFSVLASSRFNRADIDDPAPTVKLLDELRRLRGEWPKPSPIPNTDWRAKATAFESFGDGWRSRWDACGLAFRPEAGAGFPHSGQEVRKLEGSLRSPTFTIDKPYLAIRVAGRESQARVILNGLHLIQEPIYGGLAKKVAHGDELRWLVFDLKMWKGQPAYLELLDDGPGYVAIREAWFADTQPPADAVERVPIPEYASERARELEGEDLSAAASAVDAGRHGYQRTRLRPGQSQDPGS